MSAMDRLSSGYLPDFDHDLEVGRQGELFITSLADALRDGTATIETKADHRIAQTGNVYIEYHCRGRDGVWRDSGILATHSEIWVFVLPANVVIAAPTQAVYAVFLNHGQRHKAECVVGSNPTKGVAIPVGKFVSLLYQYKATRRDNAA